MKTLNRTLSLALVFALVFSLMSFAFAADTTTTTTTTTTPTTTTTTTTPTTTTTTPAATTTTTAATPAAGTAFTDASSISHTSAVNAMTSLSVIKGYPDGSYKPATNVTRAEMAKMICLILNGGKEPVLSTSSTPKYTDIGGHWAQAYIEYCASANIVAGMGDGTFHPDDTVTASQAAKMLLVAMNYKADIFNFTGADWEVNVNVAANKAGIYADITDINASANLNRDNAAQMIYNSIFSKTMTVGYIQDQATGKIQQQYNLDGDSLAVAKFGLYTESAVISHVSYNSAKKEYGYTFSDGPTYLSGASTTNPTQSTLPADDMKTTTDYSQYVGMKVKILWNKTGDTYNVFGVYPYDSTVKLSSIVGVMANGATFKFNSDNTVLESMTFGGTTYKFASTVPVYNSNDVVAANKVTTLYTYITSMKTLQANATAASLNYLYTYSGSTTYTLGQQKFLNMLSYTFKMIDQNGDGYIDEVIVDPYTVEKVTYAGSTSITTTNVATNATASYTLADVNAYTGIATGDFVKHTAAANTSTGVDKFEKLTPAAGTISASAVLTATISGIPTALGDYTGMTAGANYENIVYVNGFVYHSEMKTDAVSAEKFALVTKVATNVNSYGKYVAKLLFSNGTITEVTLDKDPTGYWGGNLAEGDFVTFTVSSGVYTLTKASVNGVSVGHYTNYYSETAAKYNYEKGTIDGMPIDDSAIVFANTDTGYKVITGKDMKGAHTFKDVPTPTLQVFTKKNTSTGFSPIVCACVDLRNQIIGSTQYGYVTAAVQTVKNKDNVAVSQITFWNGTKDVTMTADEDYTDLNNVTTKLAQGMYFTYTVDKDNIITINDVDSTVDKVQFFRPTLGYVAGHDTKSVTFDSSATAYDYSSAVIFNIDSVNMKGKEGNAIFNSNTNNAVYYVEDNATKDTHYARFIAVDTSTGKMTYTGPTSVTLQGTETAAKVQEYLTAGYSVVYPGNLDAAATALDVKSGLTLTVTGTFTSTATNTITGTLTAKNIAGAGTYNVDSTGSVITNGTGTTGTIAAATINNAGTVKATGLITAAVTNTTGTVTAQNGITGDVSNTTGSVSATTITGNVTNSSTGAVSATTIAGKVTNSSTGSVTADVINGAIANSSTGTVTVNKASTGITTINNAGTVALKGACTTSGAVTNSGTITVAADSTFASIADGMTGKITIDKAKKLTVAAAANIATLKRIFGAADGAMLVLSTQSSDAGYTTVVPGTADAASYAGVTSNNIAASASGYHYAYTAATFTWANAAD